MIIHDPPTRDHFWSEAGGSCGIFGHKINKSQAILERNDSYTKVIGWMASITYLPEVITEVSKLEFRDLFTVVRVHADKISDLYCQDEDLTEEDVRWFNKHQKVWPGILAWTCWNYAGDPDEYPEERAYWWGLLNVLCNDIFRQVPSSSGLKEVRFVLPAGLMNHPLRVDGNHQCRLPWHQLVLLSQENYTRRDLCSSKAILAARAFLDQDPTPLMFDQEYRHRIQAVPVDPGLSPFMVNPVNPKCWSVPRAIQNCRAMGNDDLAKEELLTVVFESLEKTLNAHLVDSEEARTAALEIAVASLVVATDESIDAHRIDEISEGFGVSNFDSERAQLSIKPLFEASRQIRL